MKLGLALSGGGIKGVVHAGVLRALEENNITVDIIGGTSSGSIIAGLYAMGYTPYYIYILFKKYAKDLINQNSITTISSLGNMLSSKKTDITGFYSGKEIEEGFNNVAARKGVKNILDIKMPIVIPTVNLQDSQEYIFSNIKLENNPKYITDISIGKAIRASCSFPVAFSPCDYQNYRFVDGGILDNIPATEVRKNGADKVISINFEEENVTEQNSVMDIIMKSVDIMTAKITEENLKNSDLTLTIKTPKTGLLEVEKIDECYGCGYRQTLENLEKISKLINSIE